MFDIRPTWSCNQPHKSCKRMVGWSYAVIMILVLSIHKSSPKSPPFSTSPFCDIWWPPSMVLHSFLQFSPLSNHSDLGSQFDFFRVTINLSIHYQAVIPNLFMVARIFRYQTNHSEATWKRNLNSGCQLVVLAYKSVLGVTYFLWMIPQDTNTYAVCISTTNGYFALFQTYRLSDSPKLIQKWSSVARLCINHTLHTYGQLRVKLKGDKESLKSTSGSPQAPWGKCLTCSGLDVPRITVDMLGFSATHARASTVTVVSSSTASNLTDGARRGWLTFLGQLGQFPYFMQLLLAFGLLQIFDILFEILGVGIETQSFGDAIIVLDIYVACKEMNGAHWGKKNKNTFPISKLPTKQEYVVVPRAYVCLLNLPSSIWVPCIWTSQHKRFLVSIASFVGGRAGEEPTITLHTNGSMLGGGWSLKESSPPSRPIILSQKAGEWHLYPFDKVPDAVKYVVINKYIGRFLTMILEFNLSSHIPSLAWTSILEPMKIK